LLVLSNVVFSIVAVCIFIPLTLESHKFLKVFVLFFLRKFQEFFLLKPLPNLIDQSFELVLCLS